MNRRQFCGLTVSGLAILATEGLTLPRSAWAAASTGSFFFKDGDRVVMIGDSITEQHLHSNYVESYTVSRFPQAHFELGNGADLSS